MLELHTLELRAVLVVELLICIGTLLERFKDKTRTTAFIGGLSMCNRGNYLQIRKYQQRR